MPSIQKWLAVTTTTSIVAAGYSSTSQRHRERAEEITMIATRIAQPTCIEGIADSWSALKPATAW